ncbi:MAG: RHS domain-containing protein, partial [Myxococcota bacterium]|nr:RHS domain-containing protein [Myxococcota bacterium]
LGRRTFKKFRGKVTRWVWDGNVPLHEWTEKEVSPPRRVEAPPAQTAEADEIASTQRDIALVTHPAQGPPEGTAEAPITWLFEPESFSPLGKLVGGQRFGIVTDHLGTPVRMFDEDGREAWGARVDGYGGLRHVRGDRQACPFRWPGQYEDEETGLYCNRFRYYDPTEGLFVCERPCRPGGWACPPGVRTRSPDFLGSVRIDGLRGVRLQQDDCARRRDVQGEAGGQRPSSKKCGRKMVPSVGKELSERSANDSVGAGCSPGEERTLAADQNCGGL